jgi:hypothetical protein
LVLDDPAMPVRVLVCGLPEPQRSGRLILSLEAFIDDSGRGQGNAFVLSGYLSTAERWESFSREWQEELDRSPSIKYFKMKEAYRRTGEFKSHTRVAVDERLTRLISIMREHVILGFTVGLSIEPFQRILVPFLRSQKSLTLASRKLACNPYFHCFYRIIVLLLDFQWRRGQIEPIKFIFDEQGKEGRRVRDYWYLVKAMMPYDDLRRMMTSEPGFESDKAFLPLQAADMTAWNIRRYLHDLSKRATIDDRVEMSNVLKQLDDIPHIDQAFQARECNEYIEVFKRSDALVASGETLTFERVFPRA